MRDLSNELSCFGTHTRRRACAYMFCAQVLRSPKPRMVVRGVARDLVGANPDAYARGESLTWWQVCTSHITKCYGVCIHSNICNICGMMNDMLKTSLAKESGRRSPSLNQHGIRVMVTIIANMQSSVKPKGSGQCASTPY